MLKINNLTTFEVLDDKKMIDIKGGFDPFAHLGLASMMNDIPGFKFNPLPEELKDDEIVYGMPVEAISVEDINHTEITTGSTN